LTDIEMKKRVGNKKVVLSRSHSANYKMVGSKKADMSLPFGLIFSIILIVVFIIIAFIAVKNFLNIGDCAKVGQGYDKLQQKIDTAWRSQISEFEYELSVPSGITKICFANLSEGFRGNTSKADYETIKRYSVYDVNTYLVPPEKACEMSYKQINHIDLEEITKNRNPYCINLPGKITISKGTFDKFVKIS
jgi:hypothetical protein